MLSIIIIIIIEAGGRYVNEIKKLQEIDFILRETISLIITNFRKYLHIHADVVEGYVIINLYI